MLPVAPHTDINFLLFLQMSHVCTRGLSCPKGGESFINHSPPGYPTFLSSTELMITAWFFAIGSAINRGMSIRIRVWPRIILSKENRIIAVMYCSCSQQFLGFEPRGNPPSDQDLTAITSFFKASFVNVSLWKSRYYYHACLFTHTLS